MLLCSVLICLGIRCHLPHYGHTTLYVFVLLLSFADCGNRVLLLPRAQGLGVLGDSRPATEKLRLVGHVPSGHDASVRVAAFSFCVDFILIF